MLVGRDTEIAHLAGLLALDLPVTVLGESGVGKTVLMRAAAELSRRGLLEGGGLSTLSWMPHLPIARALGRPVRKGDPEATAAWVAREVGSRVLLVDDLQWVDRETRDLVSLLSGRVALLTAVRRGDPGTASVVRQVEKQNFEIVHLEGLGDADAAALLRRIRPDLATTQIQRLLRLAGGNPLLLEELASTGRPSPSLRLSLAARLRFLPRRAQEAMTALSLLGRPADPGLAGEGVSDLIEAGLVTSSDGQVVVRHALLGEVLLEEVPERGRRRSHLRLAQALPDPGESARHYAAAGESRAAFAKAMEAADAAATAGERATHLALAATLATGSEASRLRLQAATALDEAGDHRGAEQLVAGLEDDDPNTCARIHLLRARGCWSRGDNRELRAQVGAGLKAIDNGASSDRLLRARLLIEQARLTLWVDWNASLAIKLATRALHLARSSRADEHLALRTLGKACAAAGSQQWERHLQAALDAARGQGDLLGELETVDDFILAHMFCGQHDAGRRLAGEMAERASHSRFQGWETLFRTYLVLFNLFAGEYEKVLDDAPSLLTLTLGARARLALEVALSIALIDLGKGDETSAHVERALAGAGRTGRGLALWVQAEANFWAGKTTTALHNPCESETLAFDVYSLMTFARLTRAWAAVEVGRDPGPPLEKPPYRLLAGAPFESSALSALWSGQHLQAAALFQKAAAEWNGRFVRHELRSLLGAGEALRQGGKSEEARRILEVVETRATEYRMEPLLARVRRSLRQAGVRRTTRGSAASGVLTEREQEVMSFVASGLTNVEIGRRLGLNASTVARFVAMAAAKLGATTRPQTAMLAAQQ